MTDMVLRKELAEFLRSRREATDPATLGLRPGPRRRTPGLRREELAQLAGVSVTWYTWLEQARSISVSRQVIESLANTLRMDPPERGHLFLLAGLALSPGDKTGSPLLHQTLRRLVHIQRPNPAYVANPWGDLLAHNDAFSALVGGISHRPAAEQNALSLVFTDGPVRERLVDWEMEARAHIGEFRTTLARYADDPRGPELVQELRTASARFDELWQEHEVTKFEVSGKTVDHPQVGRLELEYIKLAVADHTQLHLMVFLPGDEATASKLPALSAHAPDIDHARQPARPR